MLEAKVLSSIVFPNDGSAGHATSGPCPSCARAFRPLVDLAPSYFQQGKVTCSHCGTDADLWSVVLGYAMAIPASAWSLTSLGAESAHLVMPMRTGDYYTVNIRDHGATEDARILSASYTSQGGPEGAVTALETHGNMPLRRVVGTEIGLYGRPLGEGPIPRTGNVAISIVWIRAEDSESWPYLVSAFESVAARDYAPALVFAQSAVEISLMPMISKRLKQRVGAKRVEAFMKDSLVYSHGLNVVLPYLCGEIGIQPLPEVIRGSLNTLRGIRNEIIHEGVSSKAISRETVTEGLTAAVFGFEFMRYAGPLLLQNKAYRAEPGLDA